ncbi:hypothetical protein NLG97_g5570 [Lecanicillium saksenae]|uniref:Uncharacterized protein n=1 Tax=Lecanicillium saksenae TaxID=468837 RepID=A0ACC1QVX5_9HYPO|nr:hypothetical protein NLG97_g5570 [Lecanicillium saksenae]
MHAALVSVLVGSQLALALPATSFSSSTSESQTFGGTLQYNGKLSANGPLALAKAYAKYGTPVPEGVAKSAAKAAAAIAHAREKRQNQGSVTAFPVPEYDREYLAEVEIGTPPQKLYLDFDTGSSDLWVFSNETPSSQVHGQKRFDASSSSSAKIINGATWNISYNDGTSCSGDVVTDVVRIGGLTVSNQAVELAKQVSSGFTNGPSQSSGLLGLGFDNDNRAQPKQKTWFSNIQSSLKAPIFTTRFRHQANGTYNFGYIDSSQYSGSITYTSVSNDGGHWGWDSTGYGIGSGSFRNTRIHGIADTGTSLLLFPDSIVKAYYGQVSGSQKANDGYKFDCDTDLPDFVIGVESSRLVIPGGFMSYGYYNPDDNTCFGGIQSNNGGATIFGDTALKAALVVFDVGKNRLGWAQGA